MTWSHLRKKAVPVAEGASAAPASSPPGTLLGGESGAAGDTQRVEASGAGEIFFRLLRPRGVGAAEEGAHL